MVSGKMYAVVYLPATIELVSKQLRKLGTRPFKICDS